MKLEIKIPKGWRKVRPGERLMFGDLYPDFNYVEWSETSLVGHKLLEREGRIYIRRIAKKRK